MIHSAFSRFAHIPLALLVPAAIVAPALPVRAEEPDQEESPGEAPERYAQVKALEGDVRIHKGDVDDTLSRGTPVAEGDVVESRGRGILQLGDGTRIAFAGATRFKVASLFQDHQGSPQVLLRLDYGRIRVQAGSDSNARIRVDTPSGIASLAAPGGFTLEQERDATIRLRVHHGRVDFSNEADQRLVNAGERLTAYGDRDRLNRIRAFNTYDSDSFDTWCERGFAVRRLENAEHLPASIRYYADDLNTNGQWVYVDDCATWCWRPTGISVEWRPYWRGRWASYAGGMTWISDEPWGYVTHHHGRWGWHARWGWYWIPGIYYSPAWVAWRSHDAYFGWAPLGYWNQPCSWGYGSWGGGHCWNVVNITYINAPRIHRHIHSDGHIIRTFNPSPLPPATGGRSRDLTPGWSRSRLILTPKEFQNPTEINRVVNQRPLLRDRLVTYERQTQASTGRALVRMPVQTPTSTSTPSGQTPARDIHRVPFEPKRAPETARPLFRERPQAAGPVRDNQPMERRLPDRTHVQETPSRQIERPSVQSAPRVEQPHTIAPREPAPRQQEAPSRQIERPSTQSAPRVEQPHTIAPREPAPRQQETPSRQIERPSAQPAPRVEERPRAFQPAPHVERPREMPQPPSRPSGGNRDLRRGSR